MDSEDAINDSGTAAAVLAGQRSVSAAERVDWFHGEEGSGDQPIPVGVGADGTPFFMKDVLMAMERRRPAPLRMGGDSHHLELDSFVNHVNRQKVDQTVAWADFRSFAVTAIYDYNGEGAEGPPGWLGHRAIYTCPRSPEWIAWTALDGKPMSQDAFADLIETRLEDVGSGDGMPTAIELLEMARNLSVRQEGTFQRKIDPTTGTGILVSKTEHGAESTKIPRAFVLALRVFEGGARYAVEARIRFQMVEGRPMFRFELYRRVELERDAFAEVRDQVAKRCAIPVFAGAPESAP